MKEIGGKIRKDRITLGWSLKILAEKVHVSPMTLQRIEKGQTSPSVVLLSEIAYHLKKPLNSFFKDKQDSIIHIKAKNQNKTESSNLKLRILAPKGLIDENITISYCEAKAEKFIDEHTNDGHEWVFIIKGKAIIEHNGRVFRLNQGDSLYFDARYTHSVTALKRLMFLAIYFKGK
jgi:transcriptional regulator with XRE-family HTH domain